MDVETFLIQLVLILFSARLLGELAAYCKIPSVIGELMAGVVIGPSLLGIIDLSEPIHLLAEVGIILLLFEVGLETDVSRLTAAGLNALAVAIGGVIFPFVGGFCICYYWFDFSFLASLFIGCTITATSIGITLRVLQELKKQDSNATQIIIGAAVLDDIIGIILLSILFEFSSSGEVNLWNAGKLMVFIVLFFIISPLAAKCVSLTIQKWDEKSNIPGLLPTMIVALILFFSWIAHHLGAPALLGGFAAGLALSKKFFFPFVTFSPQSDHFSHRVEEQMNPIINLFTPIFFVSIGLALNLKAVDWHSTYIWMLTGFVLVVAILGKLFSGFLLVKLDRLTQLIVGVAMIPRGEVGLIFANVGRDTGVFKNDVYASMILVIAITTLLAPFALRWIFQSTEPEKPPSH